MAQVKVYGVKENLNLIKLGLSDIIHSCVVEALQYPPEKRFHRFFPLDRSDFIYGPGRTNNYIIVEITMFEGRSVQAKKQLIRLLFERISASLGIAPQDIEIAIFETPRQNWGIRGMLGDEIDLDYKVEV